LAHAHLSSDNNDIIFGNFIADSVKGKSYQRYRKDIVTGILLHRKIDSFTDNHSIFKSSREIISSDFGKFSGIVIDIYYDHFLATNWSLFDNRELSAFISHVYGILANRFGILPTRVKKMLPFMIGQNWLLSYSNLSDLERVFRGMNRRTNYLSGMDKAVEVLLDNYEEIKSHFMLFYPELEKFSHESLIQIQNENHVINKK
jgi:Uncharacterized protein conserved in bacteria